MTIACWAFLAMFCVTYVMLIWARSIMMDMQKELYEYRRRELEQLVIDGMNEVDSREANHDRP